MNTLQFLENLTYVASSSIGVEQLKMLILNLAVRGKLTSQNEQDTPVSVILNTLESQNGYKSSKIDENEKPFTIPSSWEWVRFGDMVTFSAGKTPLRREQKYWEHGQYPWVSISDMINGGRISNTREMVSQAAYEEIFNSNIVPKETLLMSFKLSIGKLSILNFDAFHNEAIIAIYPHIAEFRDYLFKCLNGFDLLREASGAIKGKTLNRKTIENIVIAIPPIEEQQRIVAKTEALMALCDQLEFQKRNASKIVVKARDNSLDALIRASSLTDIPQAWQRIESNFSTLFSSPNSVEPLRKFIYDMVITGRLSQRIPDTTPISKTLVEVKKVKKDLVKRKAIKKPRNLPPVSGNDEPAILPSNWQWVRLGEICKEIEYGTSQKASEDSSGVPVLRMGNIVDGKIDLKDLKYVEPDIKDLPRLYLKNGDLIFNRTNSYELVGKMGLFENSDDKYTFASYLIRVSVFDQYVLPEWVNLFLGGSNTPPLCGVIRKILLGIPRPLAAG